jgi:hypothetical protein
VATPKKVVQLVQLFDRNLEAYRSGKYNETQVRKTTLLCQIDQLVYGLYDLTEEEIGIVEKGNVV